MDTPRFGAEAQSTHCRRRTPKYLATTCLAEHLPIWDCLFPIYFPPRVALVGHSHCSLRIIPLEHCISIVYWRIRIRRLSGHFIVASTILPGRLLGICTFKDEHQKQIALYTLLFPVHECKCHPRFLLSATEKRKWCLGKSQKSIKAKKKWRWVKMMQFNFLIPFISFFLSLYPIYLFNKSNNSVAIIGFVI